MSGGMASPHRHCSLREQVSFRGANSDYAGRITRVNIFSWILKSCDFSYIFLFLSVKPVLLKSCDFSYILSLLSVKPV
jgi:hypothetical protein